METKSVTIEKQYDPTIAAESVVEYPDANTRRQPVSPIILNVAMIADELVPWGYDVKARDLQLRNFWHTEPILASAVNTMTYKLSTLEWEIVGSNPSSSPKNTIRAELLLRQ